MKPSNWGMLAKPRVQVNSLTEGISMKILLVALICACCVSCQSLEDAKRPVRPPIQTEIVTEWQLLEEGRAIQLDTSHTRTVGQVEVNDRGEILREVGRIVGIHPEIDEIMVLGDDLYTAAVRVTDVEKVTVYLVRIKSGRWVISHVVFRQN
jgi:hypothetical protein